MGEEEKKPEEKKMEEKKPEETKKPEEEKKPEPKAQKPGDEKKEDKKTEESKDPSTPPEIVLRVFMHCEGCAKKVRKCLKGFQGVEEVKTDCKTHKVVVKGEKADPMKVLERVQRKSHRQVELLTPIPKPPAEEPKKAEEKKEEPQVIIVVLKVHMHCEACAQKIKKGIQRMKGVESADPDLKSSQVTVKGVFDPPKLIEYVNKRTGKKAVIIHQEPEKKEDNGKNEKKGEEAEKTDGESKDKKEGAAVAAAEQGEAKAEVVEPKKNEFYYNYPQNYQIYPPSYAAESYAYAPAPQMFSDENPNACFVM